MPTEHRSADPAVAIFLLVLVIAAYVVPSIIAVVRGHPNAGPIVVINILLGWSLLGWAAALAWSLSHIKSSEMTVNVRLNPGRRRQTAPKPPKVGNDDEWLDHLS